MIVPESISQKIKEIKTTGDYEAANYWIERGWILIAITDVTENDTLHYILADMGSVTARS